MDYTKEMIVDVTEREKKALDMLKELQLTPAAQIVKVNISEKLGLKGKDIFCDLITPYLQDTKYTQPELQIETPVETVDNTKTE